jgi:hypothetical protein
MARSADSQSIADHDRGAKKQWSIEGDQAATRRPNIRLQIIFTSNDVKNNICFSHRIIKGASKRLAEKTRKWTARPRS